MLPSRLIAKMKSLFNLSLFRTEVTGRCQGGNGVRIPMHEWRYCSDGLETVLR